MKKKCRIFLNFFAQIILVSIIHSGAVSGTDQTDSLRQVVFSMDNSRDKADKLLLLVSEYYNAGMMDSAMTYCEIARVLSTSLDYPAGIAEALYKNSVIHYNRGDFNASLSSIRPYLKAIKPLNDIKGLGKGYSFFGILLREQGKIDSAIYFYHESLAINISLKDTFRIIAVYNSIGNLFQETSDYDSAAYYFMMAIRLSEESGNQKLLGNLYNNLGKTFTRLDEFEDAKKYLDLALEINKKNNDVRSVALNLINLGNNCARERKLDSALLYYDRATDLLKPYGEVIELTDLYMNYAAVYKENGNYQLAIENLTKALNYYQEQKQAEGTMIALKNIGDIYYKQNKFGLARSIYDSSLNIAIRTGYRKNRLDILQAISGNYYKSGDFHHAYEYQVRYIDLKDSLFDIDKTKVINDLTFKYEKEKDQARILTLEKENLQKDLSIRLRTNQRNAYLFTGIGILALTVFLLLYFRQNTIKDKIIARQRILQLEEEKKLMAAKFLVEGQEEERKRIATELHDGLGVLLSATKMQFSVISDNSPENKELIGKASRMLEQASGDVRMISHNMMPGLLTKLGFYEAVEDLFENITDTKGLNAICTITGPRERLPENNEIMLYRIIQEMVNNTLKHAQAGHVELQIQVLPGVLDIKYADDGTGFDFMQKLESESLGLKSIQTRINFLDGNLVVESKPGKGVKYSFQVPV